MGRSASVVRKLLVLCCLKQKAAAIIAPTMSDTMVHPANFPVDIPIDDVRSAAFKYNSLSTIVHLSFYVFAVKLEIFFLIESLTEDFLVSFTVL